MERMTDVPLSNVALVSQHDGESEKEPPFSGDDADDASRTVLGRQCDRWRAGRGRALSVFAAASLVLVSIGVCSWRKSDGYEIGMHESTYPTIDRTRVQEEEEAEEEQQEEEGGGVPYKVYPPWEKEFPCYPQSKSEEYERGTRGIFYVKVPKTASSTIAGVAQRIAHRKGTQILGEDRVCNAGTSHGGVIDRFHYDERERENSFLFTFVREPTRRTVSNFFFEKVSRRGYEPTDRNFLKYVRGAKKASGTYQLDYVRLSKYESPDEAVRGTLDEYNFIGVTERLDESLAVLQLLLGVGPEDTLYLSAKKGGFAYVLHGPDGGDEACVNVTKSFVSPAMKEYFDSEEWLGRVEGDNLLYRAANRSLDETIDALGRERVEARLSAFRDAQILARERCEDRAVFPCSEDGTLLAKEERNCYAMDQGCGYPCLDEVAEELDAQTSS